MTDTSIPPDTFNPDPNTYKRQFSDDELEQMNGEIGRRVSALLEKGVPVNYEMVDSHRIIGLLEVLVGPEKAKRVREWNLMWVGEMLDQVESQVRVAEMLEGKR